MSIDARSAADEAPDAAAMSFAPAARASRNWSGTVFVAPFLAVSLVFLIYPLLAGIVLSLHKAICSAAASYNHGPICRGNCVVGRVEC